MTMKGNTIIKKINPDANFEVKMAYGFIDDMSNLVNLNEALKSLKICTLRESFAQGI